MNDRLQKKCLIGSAILHGSLCVTVLIFSACHTPPPPPPATVLELFPFAGKVVATDGPSHGGGAPPPVKSVQQVQKPQPPPVAPPPPKAKDPEPEKEVEKEVVKETPKVIHQPKTQVKVNIPVKDDGELPNSVKSTSKTKPIKISLNTVVRNDKSTKKKTRTTQRSEEDSEYERESKQYAQRQKDLAARISGAADSLARNTAQSVVSDSIGDNTSGVASVNYNTIIFTRYYNAWNSPSDVDDTQLSVDVEIMVARDGAVLSASLEKRSRNASMDRSVEQALRVVKRLEPFPSAWKESQRTFTIRFNLKSKLGLG